MNKKRIFNKILLIIAVIVFTVSAVFLILHFIPDNEDLGDFKNSADVEVELPENPIDFAALKEKNPDVIGWITVKDMNIDYPVLQSGIDKKEDFYLKHDIDGKWKNAGSIYVQRYNNDSFLDRNTILYGHHLSDKSMFTPLWDLRKAEEFKKYDTVYIYTPGHILTYKIFSAFIYDDRHILNAFDFSNAEEYNAFLDDCFNPRTLVKNVREDVKVTPEDRIITLSTCTNSYYYSDERFLVVAVLTNDTKTK